MKALLHAFFAQMKIIIKNYNYSRENGVENL
jgi:hypothetical protein